MLHLCYSWRKSVDGKNVVCYTTVCNKEMGVATFPNKNKLKKTNKYSKKKIALFLAAAMTVSALPMTAFASTTNTVSKIATVETDDKYESTIVLDEFKGMTETDEKQTIKLTLVGSEFQDAQFLHGQRSVTRKLSQHSQLLTTTQIQLNSLSRLQLKTKVTQQLQSKLQMQ